MKETKCKKRIMKKKNSKKNSDKNSKKNNNSAPLKFISGVEICKPQIGAKERNGPIIRQILYKKRTKKIMKIICLYCKKEMEDYGTYITCPCNLRSIPVSMMAILKAQLEGAISLEIK